MKKLKFLFTMTMIALMSLSFSSCDDDADVAYTLDGTWKGYLQTQISWDGRYYQSSTAQVTFNSGYDSGDGYWLDMYSNAPWDYVENYITWKVRNGIIYITFHDTRETAEIRDYHLDNDGYFYGSISFNNGNTWADFKFIKTSAPNWNRYYRYGTDDWYHSWGYYGSYAKEKTRAAQNGEKDSLNMIRRIVTDDAQSYNK